MNEALDNAKHSNMNQRHGAVVVKNGKVLSRGHNRIRARWPSVHAEMDALLSLSPKERRGSTVYVARIGSQGEVRNSKPCLMCERCMRKWGVHTVVWSFGDDKNRHEFQL
jgi:tRNA(Arg) A34 adenosine deaminase TadA